MANKSTFQSSTRETLVISQARLLQPVAGLPDTVDIVIADGVIVALEPQRKSEAGTATIDARNRIAAPGLVNGHQHSHELFFRGRSEGLTLEEWMTSVRPVKPLPLTCEDVYARTLAVAVEALRSGTTTICDDVGIDPVSSPDLLDAAVRAYRDAGIRAFVGPSLFDIPFVKAVPFATEELPGEAVAAISEAFGLRGGRQLQLDAFSAFAARLKACGGIVMPIAAPSAPQRCTRDFLMAVRGIADDLDLPLMTHVLETRVQAAGARIDYGKTMVAYLADLGFLKPKTSLIHGVWLTRADMEMIAASNATVQHNPWSNLKLASGLARLRALLRAGVNVSLGSDGCGSVETVSMLPAVAAAALLSTLRGEAEDAVLAQEAFAAATLGGARALGLDGQVGRIAVGLRADIVLYRLDRAPFMPLNDPVRQLVYGMPGGSIDTVIVDGRVVMKEGRMLSVDENGLSVRVEAAHRRLLPDIDEAERTSAVLRPGMRAIVRRCCAVELGTELDRPSSRLPL